MKHIDTVFNVLVDGPATVDGVYRKAKLCDKTLSKQQVSQALYYGKRNGFLTKWQGSWMICGS